MVRVRWENGDDDNDNNDQNSGDDDNDNNDQNSIDDDGDDDNDRIVLMMMPIE